jgi:hypothetical protein
MKWDAAILDDGRILRAIFARAGLIPLERPRQEIAVTVTEETHPDTAALVERADRGGAGAFKDPRAGIEWARPASWVPLD